MEQRRRNSLLCPNCRKLISIDEAKCPYCGTVRPGSRWKANLWTRGFSDEETLIRAIIYSCAAMYVISLLLNPQVFGSASFGLFSFLAPSNQSLLLLGGTGTIPVDRYHRWWTLLSANYLHGGILHIFFNMVALKQIAPLVVREYGTYRMFSIYTLGGIVGFWVSLLMGVPFTVGASAAISALIGAALYFGKSRGGAYGEAVFKQIGVWAVAIFLFGFLVPGINNWGHGGGMVAGALLGILFGYRERRPETLFDKFISGGCALATVLVLLWAVGTSLYYRFL